ncbi:MAG TPA: CAP domain-containing protein [Pyrinomonadaceae bacterium]|nr:CAP domain-containing protein [Pyrinomonadaceae bacterium]
MKFQFFLLLALLFGVVGLNGSANAQTKSNGGATNPLSASESALLNEINDARAHPQVYASYLEKLKPMFSGKEYRRTGHPALVTEEGWPAVEDAIKFLQSVKPLPPLSFSQGLYLAAQSHVKDQSSRGGLGHKGSDNTFIEERVKPFGSWQGGIGENITYGDDSARERILTWLIDDGVPSRGHRRRLLSTDYNVAGISCGSHPEFSAMCVLDLAGGFIDSGSANSNTAVKSTTATKANTTTTTSPSTKVNGGSKPATTPPAKTKVATSNTRKM